MSLSHRLTLLVIVLLCLCGTGAGLAFRDAALRGRQAELERRLAVRLAWLEASLSVDLHDAELRLSARRMPEDAAEVWQVETTDGKVLWTSGSDLPAQASSLLARSRTAVWGEPQRPPLAASDVRSLSELTWERVPALVRDAALGAMPDFQVDRVKKTTDHRLPIYQLSGIAGGREYELRVNAAGEVFRIKAGDTVPLRIATRFPEYRLARKNGRLGLRLTARTSSAALAQESSRLNHELALIGALALLVTGASLSLLIGWQMCPLTRMARQAAQIGPGNIDERIGPVGSSRECVRLREAVNGMLARLDEGLDRERRFASSAAHELRTPLAQLRTTIEVALRRTRPADEYRTALEETLDDVGRLEKLIVALLHLSRVPDRTAFRGRPVSVSALLRRALQSQKRCVVNEVGSDDFTVAGDDDLFAAALGNVLENAARYAPGAPPTIRAEPVGDHIHLVVADRGPGVPESERERIFQPLTRLNRRRAVGESDDGFGLGLTVARSTVRAFGGDLVCRAPERGTSGSEFVFTFRRTTTDSEAVPASLASRPATLSLPGRAAADADPPGD